MIDKYRNTGNECPVCEDGMLLQHDHERFCDTCYTVLDEYAFGNEDTDDAWELFWSYRDEYRNSDSERVKAVGGFARSYP